MSEQDHWKVCRNCAAWAPLQDWQPKPAIYGARRAGECRLQAPMTDEVCGYIAPIVPEDFWCLEHEQVS